MNCSSLFCYVYIKQNLHIDTRYIHLQETNGYDGGVTCSTLGYDSILTRNECIDAAKETQLTKDYVAHSSEVGCRDNNPNHCFSNTVSKKIFFKRADCPVHQDRALPKEGLICRKKGVLRNK